MSTAVKNLALASPTGSLEAYRQAAHAMPMLTAEEERELAQFALAAAENFGYRQLISFWRLHGMISALRGVRTWGEQERRGFDDVSVPLDEPSGEVEGND